MLSRTETYRLKAAQCLQASKDLLDAPLKALYLEMAKQWLDLARASEAAEVAQTKRTV